MYQFTVTHGEIRKNMRKYLENLGGRFRPSQVNDFFSEYFKSDYHDIMITFDRDAQLDFISSLLIIKEIAQYNSSCAAILCAHYFTFIEPLRQFGTDEQKRMYGSSGKIGVLAVTEPGGANLETLATSLAKKPEGYVLRGTKSMVTFGRLADFALVLARNDEQSMQAGFSFVMVSLDSPGVTRGKTEKTMGLEYCEVASLTFDDCLLPPQALLGSEHGGLPIIDKVLQKSRLANGVMALALSEKAYQSSIKYLKERRIGKRLMADHEYFRFEGADMHAKLKNAELLLFYAAELQDRSKGTLEASSIAKLIVADIAQYICDKAIQIHGGYGYNKEFPVEQLYRDVRIQSILGGSSEMIKAQLANEALNRIS